MPTQFFFTPNVFGGESVAAIGQCCRVVSPRGCAGVARVAIWLLAAAAFSGVIPFGVALATGAITEVPVGEAIRRDQRNEPPSPELAQAVYNIIRRSVDEWSMPYSAAGSTGARTDLPAAQRKLLDRGVATAAAVQLRLDGKLIGRGTAVSVSIAGQSALGLAEKAMTEAYAEADRRMPLDRDALRSEQTRALVKRVTLSLELAGPQTPIEVVRYAQLDGGLVDAGRDGLVITAGAKSAAMLTSQQALGNFSPAESARQLVSLATGDAKLALLEPQELAAKHLVRFYKVPTTHLAQPQVRMRDDGAAELVAESGVQSPIFLTRGQRLIDRAEIGTVAALDAFACALARHLVARSGQSEEARGDGPADARLGQRGTHLPWLGTDSPGFAPPAEQALVAFALGKFAELSGPGDATLRSRAGAASTGLWAALGEVLPSEIGPASAPEVAAAVLALHTSGPRPLDAELRAAFERGTWTKQGQANAKEGAPVASIAVRALAGLAAQRMVPAGAGRKGGVGAAQSKALLAELPAEQLVGAMPWAVYGAQLAQPMGELDALVKLREVRTLVRGNQLGTEAAAELRGGVVFTAARADGKPAARVPTWSSARTAVAFGLMLGDERLTTREEFSRELIAQIESLRFLRQLMIDMPSSWMCLAPVTAMGGVRSAPFDWQCPPEATAMTLLAVTETLAAIERRGAAQK